jgi:hypothetical protein
MELDTSRHALTLPDLAPFFVFDRKGGSFIVILVVS